MKIVCNISVCILNCFAFFMLMTHLFLLNQLKICRLLLIFLKSIAQNGSSLLMFQKPKQLSFQKESIIIKRIFFLNNEEEEAKESYKYLRLLFNYNGNFCQGLKKLVDQAQKALYALYRNIYNLAIPVD